MDRSIGRLFVPSEDITVTLLDTVTGETRQNADWSGSWWMDGNGSCDCNRAILFGHEGSYGTCMGCKRYVIIDADPGWELCDLNSDYDPDLYEINGVPNGS